MDLKTIRDHLRAARSMLGGQHPLAARIETVERNLTPGDPLWHGDAVAVETDLLAILSELERLPRVTPPRPGPQARGPGAGAPAEIAPGVNEAIKRIADAIELL